MSRQLGEIGIELVWVGHLRFYCAPGLSKPNPALSAGSLSTVPRDVSFFLLSLASDFTTTKQDGNSLALSTSVQQTGRCPEA